MLETEMGVYRTMVEVEAELGGELRQICDGGSGKQELAHLVLIGQE